MKTDLAYNSNSRPRKKLKQLGTSSPLSTYHKPILQRLEVYENVAENDPTYIEAINILTNALIGSLGEIEHPDPEIQEFLQLSFSHLSDAHTIDIRDKIKELIECTMWAGFSVSENIYEIVDGLILLKDIVNYHPATITIRTDTKGRLSEGAEAYEGGGYVSGIFQSSYNPQTSGEVQLPLWKINYLVHKKKFNNYYGQSTIESMYRWHVLKEAFVDMMTITLDKYGKPSTVYVLPRRTSSTAEFDPISENEVRLTDAQVLERQLAEAENFGDTSNLILEYSDPDAKPEVKVLSMPNTVNTVFLDAIKFCEKQQVKSLLLPYGLIDGSVSNDNFSERQVEFFNRVINTLYVKFVVPFVNQSLHRLVKLNFNRDSAKYPPQIPLRKATRPEARVALMQMIKGLTDQGYFNPTEEADWVMVRQLVDCLDRPMTKEDKEFIKELLIYPKQKDVSVDKAVEGTIKGKGNQGRPTGISSPLQEARPKKKDF